MSNSNTQNDFSKGSIVKNIMNLAIPMTLAQLINVLYNIVDRIYIGRIPDHATLSLTGIGLSLPIITLVIAFANLFGMGGAPLCSIERGRGNIKEAEAIMGNSFSMMVISGVLLTVLCLIFRKPMLYLFGASDATYPYANAYITIYLLGSLFVMVGLGAHRHDDRPFRRCRQYPARSDFYFCASHGNPRCGARHHPVAASLRYLDSAVFNQ